MREGANLPGSVNRQNTKIDIQEKNRGTFEQGRTVQKPDLRNYHMMMSGAESEITGVGYWRRKVRLIECYAKCRCLKKLTCKGTLLPMFYLSEAPSPTMTPPPLHTVLYTCIPYTYSHREGGKGGGRAYQR
jgi:hypothetical protein